MARASKRSATKEKPRRSRLVLCPCCDKLVVQQTRTNHLQLHTGSPHIKAAALTYRRRVGLDIHDHTSELGDPVDIQEGSSGGGSGGLPEPALPDANNDEDPIEDVSRDEVTFPGRYPNLIYLWLSVVLTGDSFIHR